jgi:hypothetical protein
VSGPTTSRSGRRETASANERPEPREQLAEVERLHEVVVSAAIEALDPGVDGVTRCHHQDRHQRSGGADRAADGEAVFDRQHHVEDDGIVVGRARAEEGRLAIGGHINGVRLLAQTLRQHTRGARLVFDQKNAHGKSLHHARHVVRCHRAFIFESL